MQEESAGSADVIRAGSLGEKANRAAAEPEEAMLKGSDPIASYRNQTILLHYEQGCGDTLQFIRFAPLVKRRGGRVVVLCQTALLRLVARCPGIDLVFEGTSYEPECHIQAPLMSLPAIFGTTLATLPALVPYLFADRVLVEHWRSELARALELEALTIDLRGRRGRDFSETAAIMCSLDLVISPDTAVAHLAGGLGVPVWVALPYSCDWRWLSGRDDSPWYPTMRLFRQAKLGEWEPVFRRMAEALKPEIERNAGAPNDEAA